MRKTNAIPRILKINELNGFKISCVFNNGESRIINFDKLFKIWKVKKGDLEFPLLNLKEFKKVQLRNNTLSWNNLKIKLINENEVETEHPYELSPDLLYSASYPDKKRNTYFKGEMIRKKTYH